MRGGPNERSEWGPNGVRMRASEWCTPAVCLQVRMRSEWGPNTIRTGVGPYGVRTGSVRINSVCCAFTTGDFVCASLIAGGSARYIALLMNLIAFNDKVIAQMVFIAEAPKGEEDPTVTWDALKAASHAPLRDCTFADVRHLSLTLLHPTARRGSPI